VRLETVFLDAGGVLLNPNWERVAQALQRHGVPAEAAALAAAEPLAKRQLDTPEQVRTSSDDSRGWLYFDLVLSHAGIAATDRSAAAFDELRRYHGRRNLWESVPGDVRPALARLRDARLKLAVVSNSNGTLFAHLQRLDLARHFALVLDSHEEGVEKPDPRFFQIALERSGSRAETTLHLGDLYEVDVVGARGAGLRAVLLDSAELYRDHDCPRAPSLGAFVDALLAGAFMAGA
jgi:HAD superfamily hydrolase (TIGR01549 family)